jgi:hypothetical protein
MAKKTFQIAPKLAEDKKPLPVQEMSVAQIQQIVAATQDVGRETVDGGRLMVDGGRRTADGRLLMGDGEQQGRVGDLVEPLRTSIYTSEATLVAPKVAKAPKPVKKKPERPQGRPRREDKVIRVSSDLPEDLYKQMKTEINRNGYTMNGFLAKVLRGYFENLKS